MKSILIVSFLAFYGSLVIAQNKPVIDTAAVFSWPSVSGGKISPNGDYAVYTINNLPGDNNTMVIQSLKSEWQLAVIGAISYKFANENLFVYQLKDTLNLFHLDKTRSIKILNVVNYQITNNKLYYLQKDHLLICQDLKTNKLTSFSGVLSYLLNANGKLVLTKENGLFWASLVPKKELMIYAGKSESIIIDQLGDQVAFISSKEKKAIMYYRAGNESSEILTSGIQIDSLNIFSLDQFSKDNKRIFFHLIEQPLQKSNTKNIVDVWSWTDARLLSQQQNEIQPKSYLATLDIENKNVVRIQDKYDTIDFLNGINDLDNISISYVKGVVDERNWNQFGTEKYFILSSGIKTKVDFFPAYTFPEKRLYIGYDSLRKDILSFDPQTNTINNLTQAMPIPQLDPENDTPQQSGRGLQVAAIMPNRNAIIIYDRFDIWLIDLGRIKSIQCLTNGYGRKNNITFRFIKPSDFSNIENAKILQSFNRTTKEAGFYQRTKGVPNKLFTGPYSFEYDLVKALNKTLYLVERESTKESRNYFLTSDFKTFKPISHTKPELDFNWLNVELIKFTSSDNKPIQAVLYKPENFDPKNKYPCIITYYEKKSDELNHYHKPNLMADNISIPWYVSRGYVVFTPDINYEIGFPGHSAENSIDGAARMLSKIPFVDSLHIGLAGHSMGGFETNYIVTHSNFPYAAAISFSAMSDLVSGYNSITKDGSSKQYFMELHQYRIGATLWGKPQNYIDNSPVFKADRVKTPLLMMNNKGDGAVSFEQGVEFFTALRRLQKPVWMLQYDGEGHSVNGKDAQLDLTTRTTQFFDHYLKGAPPPSWMVNGIPASRKGIDNGYELIKTN